jgi:hypothetical protein
MAKIEKTEQDIQAGKMRERELLSLDWGPCWFQFWSALATTEYRGFLIILIGKSSFETLVET